MNFESNTTKCSIKLEPHTVKRAIDYAINNYNFSSYNNIGNTPNVLELNKKRYILITKEHPGVCDDEECQQMFNDNCGLEMLHTFVPVYTFNTQHELCIYHIFEKHKASVSENQLLTTIEQDVINSIY